MSKVRSKEIRQMIGGEEMNDMFDEMMGIKDADPTIIRPKFVALRNAIKTVYKLFRQIIGMEQLAKRFPSQTVGFIELHEWNQKLRADIYFESLDDELDSEYEHLDKETINSVYKHLKENKHIRELMTVCAKLKQYKDSIGDEKNLKDDFIFEEPGNTLYLFNFAAIDFKFMWLSDEMTALQKKQILIIVHRIWHNLFLIYKIITSPDIDIDRFTSLVREAMGKLKELPRLERCKLAFSRIDRSIDLLRDKFDDYYRESVASANPNLIMQNFVLDVSRQGDQNRAKQAQLTWEFGQIINCLKDMSQKNGRANDPKVKKLFDLLHKNYEVMERNTQPGGPSTSSENAAPLNMPDIGQTPIIDNEQVSSGQVVRQDATHDTDDLPIYHERQKKKGKTRKTKSKGLCATAQ